MPKRYRTQHARPGELRSYYGRAEGDGPDVCYAWGDGCAAADGHLIHNVFTAARPYFDGERGLEVDGPSFLEDLKARGYDITTLRFSIRKAPR